jgi:hypothetical protein
MMTHLRALRPHIEAIARGLLGNPDMRLSSRDQLRFGTNGSVTVEIARQNQGEWYDHQSNSAVAPGSC